MESIIILVFAIGYLSITLEHPLKLDKTVPALIMAAIMWALLAVGFTSGWFNVVDTHENVFSFLGMDHHIAEEGFNNALLHHLGKTAEILVFLIGAMTIVEIIDLHRGFEILKGAVKTKKKRKLLWIIGILAFILSAIIDNLTATIVLITLLRKLVYNRDERLWFAGMVVIAANAGGAWSPIGDVTTTMLWIADKVSALGLIEYIVIPSIICFVVPFFIASLLPVFKGDIYFDVNEDKEAERLLSSKTMLFLGLGAIVSVPVFKTLTHLPPYMGMMLALGVVWLVSEYIHPEEDFTQERRKQYSAHKALSRIEISSILFFLGILMAVAALETLVYGTIGGEEVGTLRYLAEVLQSAIPNQDVVVMMLGVFSAIIDNVPLVAASMGMYTAPMDAQLWHFIAYSAGTGGSMLIIGSAAGVAAMGMEKIDFIWYLKKIAWLAAVGFVAGAIAFLFIENYF
ncbi:MULTISPECIES: sodium:proton antiporter NhaD [Croceibacter]|jgi:Na+/H+ antiporter NhaD/arsenite permease-like protein|uniref:sodium:proton antiporter NhaD n=1 Tax=Croceibacter TaxID=216431 RepID=UPI000C6C33DB|nr:MULTISPECIES: sodium:proton antiporter NhaD [Croceibacter]MAM22819.1 sodium:proton antiporter [Croceibacter sp.]MBG26730.1 sodium:proton antiporter [Croceibacter sp.]MBW4969450.1 sodium:proton antiporter NhaD [Croceibacter atlanticus]HAT69991.1 sodium:proton antiporter [Flavobacteriaceae bacterium]|tara:strand:- start:738 stop:2108 length:1371 start_codon:yes stop_codon:yes gene_type:complete